MLAEADPGQPAEGLVGAAASLFRPGSKPGQALECKRAHTSLKIPLLGFSPGPGYGRQLGGPAQGRVGVQGQREQATDKPGSRSPGLLGALVLGSRFLVL